MFSLSIDTANAAFDDTPASELARILRKLADTLENEGCPPHGDAFRLFDANGNCVGYARVEREG